MLPSAQRFKSEYRSGSKIHLRLKMTDKLVFINRPAQIGFNPGIHVSQARCRGDEKILCCRREDFTLVKSGTTSREDS